MAAADPAPERVAIVWKGRRADETNYADTVGVGDGGWVELAGLFALGVHLTNQFGRGEE